MHLPKIKILLYHDFDFPKKYSDEKKNNNNKSPLFQEVVVFYSMNDLTLFGRIFDKQTSTHGFH